MTPFVGGVDAGRHRARAARRLGVRGGERGRQLVPRRDPEASRTPCAPAIVGPRAEEQARGDLRVQQTRGGEPRDLPLLRRQLVRVASVRARNFAPVGAPTPSRTTGSGGATSSTSPRSACGVSAYQLGGRDPRRARPGAAGGTGPARPGAFRGTKAASSCRAARTACATPTRTTRPTSRPTSTPLAPPRAPDGP